jgi:hypothetical protein
MKSLLALVSLPVCTGLLVAGCHYRRGADPNGSIEGFRFGAYASVVGSRADTLRVTATAENVSKRLLEDMSSPCYQLNRLSIVAQAGLRTWDSNKSEIAQLPVYRNTSGRVIESVCLPVGVVALIRPGGLQRFELRTPISSILGDSLEPGKYRITARIVINGLEVGDLHAGDVQLSPPPT